MTVQSSTRVWPLLLGVALAWSGCDETPPPDALPADLFEHAVARYQDNDLPAAAQLFEEAEVRFGAAGRREFQLQALSYSAQIARERGSFRIALEKTSRGTSLARQLGDFRAETALRMIEGEVYVLVGLPLSAWRSFDEAARLADTFSEQAALAKAEIAMGGLLVQKGVAGNAADHFQRALAAAQSAGREDLAADALMGLGEVFEADKKTGEAVNSGTQAIALVDRTDRPELAALLRLRLGLLQESAQNANAALTTYREGVNMLRRGRTGRRLEIQILHRIGQLYAANRRSTEARKHFNDAMEIARREGDAIAQTYLAFRILQSDVEAMSVNQRPYARIAQVYRQMSDRFRSIGQKPGEAAAAGSAAEAMLAGGDIAGARASLRRAVEAERLGFLSYLDPILHRPYVHLLAPGGRQPQWAVLLANEYFKANRIEDGLTVLDQHRQTVIADALEEADIQVRQPSVAAAARAVRTEWRDLRLTAAELGAASSLGSAPSAGSRGLEALNARIAGLHKRARAIMRSHPNSGAVVRADTVELGQLRQFVPRGISAVEFVAIGDELLTVVVSRGEAKVVRQKVDGRSVRDRIAEYENLMQDPLVYTGGGGEASVNPMTRFAVVSTELYDLLVRPIESFVDRGVVFVASDVIGRLPLHALEKQDPTGRVGYLIEYLSVDYISSWSALQFPTRPALRMQSIVAVGNPSGKNWSVDYELRDIRSFYRLADVSIGRDATWEALRAKRPDLLQLATSFGPGLPAFGTFVAADSGRADATVDVPYVRLTEVQPPPVVILTDDRGEAGGLQPTHAMLLRINGTSDVFLNRWTADRKAAKFFSEFFFTHLSNGLAPGDAYRQSLLNLIHTRDVNHPRSWAQFFHFGVG